ncbi:hypothetical protein H0H93_012375 [Arthromyces matolae]|nr:hypothetical protein H0H93_012375 [Arthromyces matolae]
MQASSPQPSYASKAASPAGSRSTSPVKETYKPIIRIPPPRRLVQAKMTAKRYYKRTSESTQLTPQSTLPSPLPHENQEPNTVTTTDVQNQVTNASSPTDNQTSPVEIPLISDASPQAKTLDKKQAKKAKKARQAAAKAAAKAAIASSSRDEAIELNEVNEGTNHPSSQQDELSSISSDPFAQFASPAPSVTHSSPRFTAAEKGKGREHTLSLNLHTKQTPSFSDGDLHSNDNPNKRKAPESPAAPTKITKKNTNMSNPPLRTPLRLTLARELTSHVQHAPSAHESNPPSPTIPPTTSGSPRPRDPPTPLPVHNGDATSSVLAPNNPDILSKLPSANDIEKVLESHIKLKPAFSGTETEFNEQTMRLQELLAAITAINRNTGSPPRPTSVKTYQIPLPPQNRRQTSQYQTSSGSPTTPTPHPRQRTILRPGTSTSHYSNPGFPLRNRRNYPATSHSRASSGTRNYLPPVSPMDEDHDGVSMVDTIVQSEREQSLPASDEWEEENGPPPYANSQQDFSPHQYPHNLHQPNLHPPRSPSIATVTEIIYDLGDDMQIDINLLNDWMPSDSPGMIVNGVGLVRLERPRGGWISTEYRFPPTHCLSAKSLAVVAEAPPHSIWILLYRANNKGLDEQETADAIRENVGKIIVVPEGTRLELEFMSVASNTTQISRFEIPHYILLTSITPNQSRYLLDLKALITRDFKCWFLPLIPQKTHFAGTIIGLQHKKEDHDEVLHIIKAALAHTEYTNLAQHVISNSNPYDPDAYRSLIANLTINFVEVLQKRTNPSQAKQKTL